MNREKLIAALYDTNLIGRAVAIQLAENFTYKKIAKNDLLLAEGDHCNEYLYLETGFMRAFATDTNGEHVTTNFYKPGDIVFEVSSFFTHVRSKENIQAITDCEGWYITYAQLNHLFHTVPGFREFGRYTLVKGFSALKNRMLAMITETAEERYAALIKSDLEVFQQVSLKYIASYLGVTDTSLSRIRNKYAKK